MFYCEVRKTSVCIESGFAQGFAWAALNAFAAVAAEVPLQWSVITEFDVDKQFAQKEAGTLAEYD